LARSSVNVIERGAALAIEAKMPSAKSDTSAIAPVARTTIPRPIATPSPNRISPGPIDVLSRSFDPPPQG
jgi:hypothetical protein